MKFVTLANIILAALLSISFTAHAEQTAAPKAESTVTTVTVGTTATAATQVGVTKATTNIHKKRNKPRAQKVAAPISIVSEVSDPTSGPTGLSIVLEKLEASADRDLLQILFNAGGQVPGTRATAVDDMAYEGKIYRNSKYNKYVPLSLRYLVDNRDICEMSKDRGCIVLERRTVDGRGIYRAYVLTTKASATISNYTQVLRSENVTKEGVEDLSQILSYLLVNKDDGIYVYSAENINWSW